MPELDTLRGVAILGVLFLHGIYSSTNGMQFEGLARRVIRVTQPGWLGVNLFFVLSGFLITGILLDSKSSSRYFVNFYTRRALRILPAYYSLLILLAILGGASWTYLGLCFLYLANVTTLFGVPEDYGPLWSLAVEEHYYLLWPLIVYRLSRRNVGIVAVLICVLTAVLRALAFHLGHRVGIDSFTWLVADGLAQRGFGCDIGMRKAFPDRDTDIGAREVDATRRHHPPLARERIKTFAGEDDNIGILASAQAIEQCQRRCKVGIDPRRG